MHIWKYINIGCAYIYRSIFHMCMSVCEYVLPWSELPSKFREPILHRRSEPKKSKNFITTPWMMKVTMIMAIMIRMTYPLRRNTTIFDAMVMLMMNDLAAIEAQHMLGLMVWVKGSEWDRKRKWSLSRRLMRRKQRRWLWRCYELVDLFRYSTIKHVSLFFFFCFTN